MRVSEIFLSIEGEGIRTGCPAVFVRLHGCNLRCSYCDSMYAVIGSDYQDMTVSEIATTVDAFGLGLPVTLTGGEPLIHKDVAMLIYTLSKTHQVNVETNGAVDLHPFKQLAEHDCIVTPIFTMDWKSISSMMADKMILENLNQLGASDVLKFVVGSVEDLDQMKHIINNYELRCNIFVSPIFGSIDPADIVEYLLNNRLYMCRMQLQLHKFIWDADKRGV